MLNTCNPSLDNSPVTPLSVVYQYGNVDRTLINQLIDSHPHLLSLLKVKSSQELDPTWYCVFKLFSNKRHSFNDVLNELELYTLVMDYILNTRMPFSSKAIVGWGITHIAYWVAQRPVLLKRLGYLRVTDIPQNKALYALMNIRALFSNQLIQVSPVTIDNIVATWCSN